MTHRISKRDLLLAGPSLGVAMLAATRVRAQEEPSQGPDLGGIDIGEAHRDLVFAAGNTVVESDPLSRASIRALLDHTVELGILTRAQADALYRLIEAIFDSASLDEMQAQVSETYDEIVGTLEQVAAAIADIVRGSVAVARELLAGVPIDRIIEAIAHDARGALDGAVSGWTLSPMIPAWARAPAAAACALIGGTSASIIGQYGNRAA